MAWLIRGTRRLLCYQECPPRFFHRTTRRITVTAVMIGVDPHKGSHTATALDATEHELACRKVRAGRRQVEQLLAWATPF